MRNINQLHPRLRVAIKSLQAKFPKIGISECVRTVAEQDALYAQGRTKPGKIVTNAKGSTYSSQHQWGIAVDFFYNDKGNLYPTSFMNEVGAYAKKLGLGWGGDWKSPVDKPHLYLPDWGSTTSKLKSQYGTPDKFMKTWNSATTTTTTTTTTTNNIPSYTVGKTYTLQSELKVRTGAGINYSAKKNSQLTADGKKHDKDKDGALDKGTKITCKEVKRINSDVWIRTPSGWIAAYYNGKIYVK